MKIWVVIYTYDKINEACAQMEIIRNLRSSHFSDIKIIHTYNWDPTKYTKKYLEDELIYLENPGHYEWAANMMDAWVKEMLKYDVDYLMINASDIWRILPEKIVEILSTMKKEGKVIWSCPWWFPDQNDRRWVGLACDTFFLDAKRERKNHIFPLNHKAFYDQYIDIIRYMGKNNVLVEALLASRYITACSNVIKDSQLWFYANDKVLILKERMPVLLSHTERKYNIPSLGLYTDHNIDIKKQVLVDNELDIWPYTKIIINGAINYK